LSGFSVIFSRGLPFELFELLNHFHNTENVKSLQKEHTGLLAKSKKIFFRIFENCQPKPQSRCQKDSLENKHGLLTRINFLKTARDIN
jgi:hypothetical protein